MNDAISRGTAAALREAAALIEAHPNLPLPYVTTAADGEARLAWFLHSTTVAEAEQRAQAAAIVRSHRGTWDKDGSDYTGWFTFTQHVGRVELFVSVAREAVCERVVVGTEAVTVPAVEAQPERSEQRELVRWECRPLLAEPTAEQMDRLLTAVEASPSSAEVSS